MKPFEAVSFLSTVAKQKATPSGVVFLFGQCLRRRDANHVRSSRWLLHRPVQKLVDTFILVLQCKTRMQANPSVSTTSSRTLYRSRRRFLFQSKRHLSLIPSLLSKPNPLRWASVWFLVRNGKPRQQLFPAFFALELFSRIHRCQRQFFGNCLDSSPCFPDFRR